MEVKQRLNRHKQRISKIRLSLAKMPIFSHTTLELAKRQELNLLHRNIDDSKQKVGTNPESQDVPPEKTSIVLQKYVIGEKVGEGAHGVVKKCYHKDSNQLYAIKSMRLDREHILFLKRNFRDIKSIHHKNIIQYHALFLQMNKEQCHLIMDYVPFPDLLHTTIKSEQQLKEIVYQLLESLAFIHSRKICHRDIKPQNILYDELNKNIKIIDFGISKKLQSRGRTTDMLTITGTPYYRAPEMFEGGGYDERVDLWALGVTIYQLMVGYTPFQSPYHSETIENILKGEYSFPPEAETKYSKSARNLVGRLLKKRNERLTARQALLDIWLIDLYQGADELTRSLTCHGRMLRIFGHSYKFDPQPFQRATTLKQGEQRTESIQRMINRLKIGYKSINQEDYKDYEDEELADESLY